MIITNNANLPAPFIRMAQSDYVPTEKRYSATTLLKPVREILLKRRHDSELEQDCADSIWLLFGKAVHSVLEQYGGVGDNEFTEEFLSVPVGGGYVVSGKIDFYDIDKGLVVDYKTASVWKVQFKDFDDWKKQGMIYAWLLWQNGLPVKAVEFYAILKDHSKREAKYNSDYPQHPVYKVHYEVTADELQAIDEFIMAKMAEIRKYEDKTDSELPLCSAADRWNDGDKYAVMAKSKKKAMRVLDSREEAEKWQEKNGGDYIEVRKGIDKKCNDYCLCCRKCSYWQSLQAVNAEGAENDG